MLELHHLVPGVRGLLVVLGTVLALAGCGGTPVGEQCKLTTGTMGFGFDDPCTTKCLELETVTCADGSTVRKAVCAGKEGCNPGSCPDGQACYSFEDPFDKEFFCIPDDICDAPPATADERLAWERDSRERSDALRAEYQRRMDRRTGATTSPVAVLEPRPAPAAPAAALPSAEPEASVLVQAWGSDLALVACLIGDTVATGAGCAGQLPAGTELTHAGWRLRTTGAKTLVCPPTSQAVPGVGAEQVGVAADSGERWGWVPAPPPSWQPASPSPLDAALTAVVRSQLRETPANLRLELAVVADLDGDPNKERIVRAFYPSDDPDKAGHSTLWLIDDASIGRLPTTGMELNGVQDVQGVVPLDSGGALLVFTTEWMGGSGLHVVGPGAVGLGPIAEVACGS